MFLLLQHIFHEHYNTKKQQNVLKFKSYGTFKKHTAEFSRTNAQDAVKWKAAGPASKAQLWTHRSFPCSHSCQNPCNGQALPLLWPPKIILRVRKNGMKGDILATSTVLLL